MTTEEFILEHRTDDVRRLALQGGHYPDVDMQYALQQIDGWQRARKKLPMWAATEGIIYPPHISMEQCSSEVTARYKSQLTAPQPPKGDSLLIDLTGGFGVDFSYMSRGFKHAIYVEKQKHLCEIAKHNFRALGLDNVEVVCSPAEEYLSQLEHSTFHIPHFTLYLDPARRDTNGHKTYAIEDCTPDVCKLMPRLRKISDRIIIKLSPMLDHREALCKLCSLPEGEVSAPRETRGLEGSEKTIEWGGADVHIVSVGNECKEILLDIRDDAEGKLFCVNDDNAFVVNPNVDFPLLTTHCSLLTNKILIVPNASIMKAGCFGEFAEEYNLQALDNNSHLFIGEKQVEYPVARSFEIESVCTLNKKELKEALKDITQANISCRNFPMTPQELRKRLKLKDGGDKYIFGTTLNDKHVLIICKK